MKSIEQVAVTANSLQVLMGLLQERLPTQQQESGDSYISMIGLTQILDVQLEWIGTSWQEWPVVLLQE